MARARPRNLEDAITGERFTYGGFRAVLRDFKDVLIDFRAINYSGGFAWEISELSITVEGSDGRFQSCLERFQKCPLQWLVHMGDFRAVLRDIRAVYCSGGVHMEDF